MGLTKKEVVAKVREHFSQPGAIYGYDKNEEKCVYRGNEDADSPIRCAMGILIPDERYSPHMESNLADRILEGRNSQHYDEDGFEDPTFDWKPLSDLFDKEVDGFFLRSLQAIHDDCAINKRPMSVFLQNLDDFEISGYPERN